MRFPEALSVRPLDSCCSADVDDYPVASIMIWHGLQLTIKTTFQDSRTTSKLVASHDFGRHPFRKGLLSNMGYGPCFHTCFIRCLRHFG